ncbi:hypothetical protein H4Q26_011790 [Puccinia striiformis f. sp. tritici PST-130]|nr:hypothetical protein H4Q26_011790 [Puccinia striiformis f. sp. tritici PST-130]
MDIDHVDIPEVASKKPKARTGVNKTENTVANEIDSSQFSITFAQLSNMSPRFTEEMIKRLSERLPSKPGGTSYLASGPQTEEEKNLLSATMKLNEDKTALDGSAFYSCALGFIKTSLKDQDISFLVDSGSMVNMIPEGLAFHLGLEITHIDIPLSGLEYFQRGEILTFQGHNGRRVQVTLAKAFEGYGWEKKKQCLEEPLTSGCLFKEEIAQPKGLILSPPPDSAHQFSSNLLQKDNQHESTISNNSQLNKTPHQQQSFLTHQVLP